MSDPTTRSSGTGTAKAKSDDASPVLVARGIRKSFAGVAALSGVDLVLRPGEVHALMGENGAGKSTLIKILTGFYRHDGGQMTFAGRTYRPTSPSDAQAAGVSVVHQEVNLLPHLTVAENVMLGRDLGEGPGLSRVASLVFKGWINWRSWRTRARKAVARLGLDIDVDRPLGSYPIAVQQIVAIARAIDTDARVLVLDEPTSSLNAQEVERLFAVIEKLKSEGVAIVFISHFLEQVEAISDRITVLRNGQLIGEFEANRLTRTQLVEKMLGRELAKVDAVTKITAKEEALEDQGIPFIEANDFGKTGYLFPMNLAIRTGEAVGISGLLGSGRSELASLLFGDESADRGVLKLDGRATKFRSPLEAMEHGFALVPEDRKAQSIFPDLSIRENLIVALQAKRGWLRPLSKAKQTAITETYMKRLRIKASGPEQKIRELSGGNQQKVILGRWLATDPRCFVLDEPTRGIDIGARFEIEALIRDLRESGLSIVLVSSEIEEILRLCQRVVVLRDRAKVTELSGEELNESRLMQAMAEA